MLSVKTPSGPYRLSLDIGSASIGWCLLKLNEDNEAVSLLDMGVRIFSDGRDSKSKEPLGVARRNARGIRRNLDRRKARQERLMQLMIRCELMPKEDSSRKQLELLDPYELRIKAVREKISLYELGRALFHINQRRGFKSNRKSDKKEKNVSSMKEAIKKLNFDIEDTGFKTLGEYLWQRKNGNNTVRVRPNFIKGKNSYDFYPDRAMYEKEFNVILTEQRKYHVKITDEVCAELHDAIFYQRPLKIPEVGKCRFENDQYRIRKAHPLFQRFRILQDVNHLELDSYGDHEPKLTRDVRKKIVIALLKNKTRTFKQIRTLLNFKSGMKFNFETESRDRLRGDDTASILGKKDAFGMLWWNLSIKQQEEIIEKIFLLDDEDELVEWLIENHTLPEKNAKKVANAFLESGYASLSRIAIEKIMPGLEVGLTYDKAVATAYPHHSDFRTGEHYHILPYYGEVLPNSVMGGSNSPEDRDYPEKFFGKINNPTVHIALNQTRKLVNSLLERYGYPEDIMVELARDLKERSDDIEKEQSKNRKKNEEINKELEKIGIPLNGQNRMRYKLWEDLATTNPCLRCCPFCGDTINQSDLFSSDYEEEHLLPFSQSYNNARSNKVIAHRRCNREKGGRTPFEAFGKGKDKERWEKILACIQNLPKNKQWRFKEDAWEIAKGKGEDIIARLLNDTRYMSKIIKQYLAAIFDNKKGKNKVYAIPGQMTALMRDKWGLNELTADVWRQQVQQLFGQKTKIIESLMAKDDNAKNRDHHLHHAIDAFVIGCTTRGMLKKVSEAANQVETNNQLWAKRHKLVDKMPIPFDGFLEQVKAKLCKLVVSHKPDHGNARKAVMTKKPFTVSKLHEETAYGLISEDKNNGKCIFATRIPIGNFKKNADLNKIADRVTKQALIEKTRDLKEGGTEWLESLSAYFNEKGIRHVRIHIEKNQKIMIPISHPDNIGPIKSRGKIYKWYEPGGNDRADIWCETKGKRAGKWQCEIISNYLAHRKNFIPDWRKKYPTAKLIMSLQKEDMVAYEEGDMTKVCRVKKMTKGLVYLRSHQISLEKDDTLCWAPSAKQLQERNARKISVDIIGRVKDPAQIK